jgi:hypothetical protein
VKAAYSHSGLPQTVGDSIIMKKHRAWISSFLGAIR